MLHTKDFEAVHEVDAPVEFGRDQRVDVIRGLACLFVVMYHVIGSNADVGLRLDYPHPLRIFADALADVRMPMFAFVSGYVYQFRPARRRHLRAFFANKVRTLLIPGLIAACVVAMLSDIVGGPNAVPLARAWEIVVLPYAHFWYLQAIFLVIVVFASLDVLTDNKRAGAVLAVSMGLYVLGMVPPTALFSANSAGYLMPYFAFGVVVHRHSGVVKALGSRPLWLCWAVVFLAAAYKGWSFSSETSPHGRLNVSSLAMGLSISFVLLYSLRLPALFPFIGRNSFVVYLYHPIGLSVMRRALIALGVHNPYLHVVPGLIAGVALPLVLSRMARMHSLTARAILGERKRAGAGTDRPLRAG